MMNMKMWETAGVKYTEISGKSNMLWPIPGKTVMLHKKFINIWWRLGEVTKNLCML